MPDLYPHHEILIVDDQQSDIILLQQGLLDAGFRGKIKSLSNGAEVMPYLLDNAAAPGQLRRPLPRCMFLDLSMPGMDGHMVLEAVKGNATTARLPVIIFSNSNRPEEYARANAGGAGGYIVKPIHYENLVSCLRGILDFWMQQEIQ